MPDRRQTDISIQTHLVKIRSIKLLIKCPRAYNISKSTIYRNPLALSRIRFHPNWSSINQTKKISQKNTASISMNLWRVWTYRRLSGKCISKASYLWVNSKLYLRKYKDHQNKQWCFTIICCWATGIWSNFGSIVYLINNPSVSWCKSYRKWFNMPLMIVKRGSRRMKNSSHLIEKRLIHRFTKEHLCKISLVL